MLKNMKNRKIEELEKQLGPRIAGSGPGTTGNRKNSFVFYFFKSLEFILSIC